MTVKEAYNKATTKFIVVTRNGKILNLNGKGSEKYDDEDVKRIDIVKNVCDGTPVVTAIRI